MIELTSRNKRVEVGSETDTKSAGEYFRTRLSTLKPGGDKLINPIKALKILSRQNWHFFLVRRPNKYITGYLSLLGCVVCLGLGCFRFLHSWRDRDPPGKRF
jgi:hypothetical protein